MAFCFFPRLSAALVLLLAGRPVPSLHAQTPAPLSAAVAAAAAITPEAIARHVRVLAADSFRGRTTLSPALERTARYVADQFARLGLTGQFSWEGGSWVADTLRIQRYPIPGQQRLDSTQSALTITTALMHRGKPVVSHAGGPLKKAVALDFRTGARLAPEIRPRMSLVGELPHAVTLLSGYHTLASLRRVQLHQQVVLYVMPPGGDSAEQHRVLAHLAAENHVLLLRADEDSAGFVRRRAAARAHPPELVDEYLRKRTGVHTWVVEVWPEAIRPVLAAAGLDWTALRAARTPEVRQLPGTQVSATWVMAPPDSTAPLVTAPNVVGVLPGTGVQERGGQMFQGVYVVISAPLDEGPGAGGLAGLLALAQAFSQSGLRPRFSLLFLATSDSGPGLWGSSAWLQSQGDALENGRIAAHLGLGGLGRGAGDSVWLAGLEDFKFAVPPAWTLSSHPELGLTVVPEDSAGSERPAAHVAFAQHGVPSLSVRGAAASSAVDLEYVARVVRAALYVGWEIATAEQRPRWTAAGRRRFLKDGTP